MCLRGWGSRLRGVLGDHAGLGGRGPLDLGHGHSAGASLCWCPTCGLALLACVSVVCCAVGAACAFSLNFWGVLGWSWSRVLRRPWSLRWTPWLAALSVGGLGLCAVLWLVVSRLSLVCSSPLRGASESLSVYVCSSPFAFFCLLAMSLSGSCSFRLSIVLLVSRVVCYLLCSSSASFPFLRVLSPRKKKKKRGESQGIGWSASPL